MHACADREVQTHCAAISTVFKPNEFNINCFTNKQSQMNPSGKMNMYAVAFLTFYFALTAATPKWFTTKSGQQIAVANLPTAFRSTSEHRWNSRIIELTTDGYLITDSSKSSLTEVPFQSRIFMPDNGVPVTIDGNLLRDVSFKYLSKEVNGYTISYHLDKTPFSVFNGNKIFRPLHRILHPGVFLDIPDAGESEAGGGDVNDDDDDGALPIPKRRKKPSAYGVESASSPCKRADPPIVLELAVAFDSTLCGLYGDYLASLAIVSDAIYMGMIPYHRQTCIRPKIVYFEGFCSASSDPYATMVARNDTLALMTDLRLLWYNSRSGVSRDLVYLITGSGSDASAVGRAYLGAVCNKAYNVAWTEGILTTTISHEIGHAFNAPHTTDGDIMSPTRNRYGARYFGNPTLATMESFIGSSGSCLSPYTGALPLLIPSDLQLTCELGFNGVTPVYKNWITIQSISYGFTAGSASVNVYYYQSSSEMYIYLWASAGHRIKRYKRRPSVQQLSSSALGEWVELNLGSSERTMSRWSWSEIDRPSTFSTCCNRQIYIHVQIQLCNNNGSGQCLSKFSRASTPIAC